MSELKVLKEEKVGYPGTDPLSPTKEAMKRYEKLARGNIKEVEDIEKDVSERVKNKIAKKVTAWISAGMVTSTSVFVALGEIGNLPGEVQEWYDETAEQIRVTFGVESAEKLNKEELTSLIAESETKKFTGLEIEGLTHVFRNGRWEYIDPNDGLMVGYWDEGKQRYEHTADVLKGEWKGLFVSQPLNEVENQSKKDDEWTIGNWQNGEIKIPIPFNISSGATIEEVKTLGAVFFGGKLSHRCIGIRDITSKIVILAPFSPETDSLFFGWSDSGTSISIGKGSISFSFDFKNTYQCLIPNNMFPDNPYNGSEYSDASHLLFLGNPILEAGQNDILSKDYTRLINPFLKEQYQVLMLSYSPDGEPTSFSFENLLRDDKGRFVFINPDTIEVKKR